MDIVDLTTSLLTPRLFSCLFFARLSITMKSAPQGWSLPQGLKGQNEGLRGRCGYFD